jgi:preprotein translocase subunit SecA
MRAATPAIPGLAWGSYPERRVDTPTALDKACAALAARLRPPATVVAAHHRRFLKQIRVASSELESIDPRSLRYHTISLRRQLGRDGFTEKLSAKAFALISAVTKRALGFGHYDTQFIAGWIMLQNQLAEMQTGEGKTLAAGLTVATAALAGIPVHVITANDYLVTRDAAFLRPVFEALGLTVGTVTQGMEADQRRAAYGCDITYCTAKELVFDYLRDRLARGPQTSDLHMRLKRLVSAESRGSSLLLRGLSMAVVDEADSILIDEAHTPLILSQNREDPALAAYLYEAMRLARGLEQPRHYRLDAASGNVELTDAARENLDEAAAVLGGLWRDRRRREELVCLALSALHLFKRDRHYLVRNDKVLIIDETTGRIAHGRSWSRGLQQLIEMKEGCTVTGEPQTLAQITYQRFFPRYLRLCGMSGTLRETRGELSSVYRLKVAAAPLRSPCRRRYQPQRVYASAELKWRAVVAAIREQHERGRPLLVGTNSVADSDHLRTLLQQEWLPYRVLYASQDEAEADVVARGGDRACITISTNMAGRGTDIPLGEGVAELGGLHVIACYRNRDRRIDRQLHGRAARQGLPGSVQTILSLDDELLARAIPPWLLRRLRTLKAGKEGALPRWLGDCLTLVSQRIEESRQRGQRLQLIERDEQMERMLAFSGSGE